MKKPLYFSIVFLLIITISACDNLMSKKFNENTFETDLKEIIKNGKIDSVDARYAAMYIIRAKFLGEKLEEKSYKEIFDNANELRKKNETEEVEKKELANKALELEKQKSERFNDIMSVALYDKGYIEKDYENPLTYSMIFHNKSEKRIRAFKGSLKIYDLFDTEIKSISLTVDDGIEPMSTAENIFTTDYNQFMDEDQRLKEKDLKDLKSVWVCEKVIFDDGSTIE